MHKDLNRKGSHMLESRMRAKDALQINKDSVISVASYTVNLQHMHKPLKSVSSPHPHSALTLPWHPGLSSVPFHIASPTPGWFHHSFTSAATHTHTHTHDASAGKPHRPDMAPYRILFLHGDPCTVCTVSKAPIDTVSARSLLETKTERERDRERSSHLPPVQMDPNTDSHAQHVRQPPRLLHVLALELRKVAVHHAHVDLVTSRGSREPKEQLNRQQLWKIVKFVVI